MIIHNVIQGSDQWIELRGKHPCASEAPVIMGASSKCTRSELLRMKATGDEKEVSAWVQKNLFDKGHEAEAMARPHAEKIIDQDLYPATATDDDDYLLASFDGITMLEDIVWENKLWNEQLAQDVRDKQLRPEYYWQLEQQLAVSGAAEVLFMCSDGTPEKMEYMWYVPVPGRREQLLAAWRQFQDDLENYQGVAAPAEAVGIAPDALPALRIEVTGMVTHSNLIEFRKHAQRVISGINTELSTDQHFADAEKTVKWCSDVETRLKAAKDHALSQTASIDELFRTLDSILEEARTKRLQLEKLVKSRKQEIRDDIRINAATSIQRHIQELEKSFEYNVRLPAIPTDIPGAMKGKRTVSTLQDAAETEVARAKVEASQLADKIRKNILLATAERCFDDYKTVFPDINQLLLKEEADLHNLIKLRITDHQEAEKKRKEQDQAKQSETAPEPHPPANASETPSVTCSIGAKGSGVGFSIGAATSSKSQRPTDSQITWLVATNYRVSVSVAMQWLQDMDFEKLSKTIAV